VKTFGERLRELRRAKGLSQRALADLVKVNFTYLSRCETGTLDFGQYPSEAGEARVRNRFRVTNTVPDPRPPEYGS